MRLKCSRKSFLTNGFRCLSFLLTLSGAIILAIELISSQFLESFSDIIFHPDKARITPTVFVSFAVLALVFPGFPGSGLYFLGGRIFGAKLGFLYIIISNQIGSSVGFLFARFLFYQKVQTFVNSRPGLINLRKATELAEWRITFLARFIFLPQQLKNYVFGILPVSFRCFFLMIFFGDLQSIAIGCYLGSLSAEAQHTNEENFKRHQRILSIIGFSFALVMSLTASFVARQAYDKAVQDVANKTGGVTGKSNSFSGKVISGPGHRRMREFETAETRDDLEKQVFIEAELQFEDIHEN